MQLQDLKSLLTFVFPVRIDCEERRENLRAVLRQLDGLGCRMLVLEADAVLHLDDGRYALVEFKLGESEIDEGAKHLLEIERLVSERNKKEEQVPLRLPDVKLVITATEYGYRREDGVCVVPIGCLRP